uniref:BMA-IRK-2, isoform e n=1 Tax=Brugia malayi TaxID=6279 RepID=A0A1I9G8H4_BRUMA|nr:BMA-IRK-2, isoform e [Brugia malayi]
MKKNLIFEVFTNVMECEDTLITSDNRERSSRFFKAPRIGSRRIRNRLVQKGGICNISLVNVPKQRRKYFSDIFTTVIEIRWRWTLLFFATSFIASWTFFFSVYYFFTTIHGDFEHINDPNWIPCIMNANSKTNIFLFSFTTQTTIGYGFRYPTTECPLIIITMCLQFMVGVMCHTLMTGVIFAKLARPIKRAATIIFSKNAVICMRDGKLCLLFRVGDMRKSSLAEAHVRLQMIKKCITYEGELLPFHQFDMDVGYDTGLDRVFVIWPITVCHEIDENSPLYEVSKESLRTARFEIIAILEGVVESVGSTTQARTSYLPNEILWGKRTLACGLQLHTFDQTNTNRTNIPNRQSKHQPFILCCHPRDEHFRSGNLLAMMPADLGLKPENAYQIAPDLNDNSAGSSPIIAIHPKGSSPRLSVLLSKGDNGTLRHPDKVETDDEDNDQTIHVDVGLQHKRSLLTHAQSPDILARHKQSIRRGPDLF